MKKIFLFLLIGFYFVIGQTKLEDIQYFTLKNGMKVIVLEDHSIPNANMYLFWKVGSRNEYPGITGISHFFEHMMFNGAKKYGFKQFDNVMEAAGGANNAYTSQNVTVYTNFFPSSALETIFDLEADRIQNLNFDDAVIESERGVVHSEYTTGYENSNARLLQSEVQQTAFQAHPYRWSVIGYESDILNYKKNDLVAYHKTYYAPNNCVVVIAGDVTLEQIKKLSEKYFEPIPAQEPPRKIHTVEPKQLGERRIKVNKEVSLPNLMIAYHVPETGSKDYYALDLLNTILSNGRSSRLYSKLVDKDRLAVSIYSSMGTSFDPYIFSFYGVCGRGATTEQLENGIYEILKDIEINGVTDQELQKAKNIKLMQFYRGMETIDNRANTVGTYELFFGSYEKLFNAPEEYNKVQLVDIQNLIKKYFYEDNRTVGVLQSKGDKK